MLHDPKWNHGTLAGLISWLEGRDPATTYKFIDCAGCLIRRYMGEGEVWGWPSEMLAIYHGQDQHKIARGTGEYTSTETYGAALERAYLARAEGFHGAAAVAA